MIRRSLLDRLRAYFLGRDIFVSYSYKDSRYAEPLAVALRDAGISVFLGAWGASPGTEFSRAVRHALLDSGILVVVATPEARDSVNVAGEIAFFAGDGRPVIAIDLRGWMSDPAGDFPALSGIDVIAERTVDDDDPKPSPPVLARIKNARTSVRQELRLRRFVARVFLGTVAILSVAAALGGWMILSAKRSEQASADAARQSLIDSLRAKHQTRAEQKKAEEAAEARNTAYGERDRANTERDRANDERDDAKAETAHQQEIAAALNQANAATMLLRQEPARLGHATLLAVDAVRQLDARGVHGLAADAAIRQTLALLPSVLHTTRFDPPIRQGQHVAVTPDRRFVAAAASACDIDVWDITSSARTRVRAEVPRLRWINRLAVSDDGSRVAANFATEDEKSVTFVWRRSDGALVASFQENPCSHALALSPDGTRVATGTICDEMFVTVRDARTGRVEQVLAPGPERIRHLSFSPTGRYLAIATNQALIWNWQSGGEVVAIPGTADQVELQFHPHDESVIAVASQEAVSIWRWPDSAVAGARPIRHYPTPFTPVREVPAFSPSGEVVAFNSLGAHTARWQRNEPARGVPMPRYPFRLAVDDHARIAVTHADHSTAIYNTFSGEELGRSADGGIPLAIGIGSDFRVRSISTTGARIWSPAETNPLISGGASSANAIAISADGSTLVVAEGSEELRAYRNAVTERWLVRVPGALMQAVALASDGRLFAGTRDGRLYSWTRAGAGNGDPEVWMNIGAAITAIAVNDARRVAFAAGQLVYDIDRRTRATTVFSHPAPVSALTYMQDGTLIAGGTDGRLLLQRGRAEVKAATAFRHHAPIASIAVSSDQRHIALAGKRRIVEVIDIRTPGEPVMRVPHPRAVSSVAFSSTGELLITGSEDGVARVWREWRTTPLEIARFPFRSDVSFVRFTPRDRFVLAGTEVEGIKRFIWDSGQLLEDVCSRLAPFVERGDEEKYRSVCGARSRGGT